MQNNYADDLLRLAARLYYVDGLGQQEVAKFTKVSQAKVSRLLAMARERGIVRITVADYEPRQRELETQLRALLGLSQAVVIKTAAGLEGDDLRRTVGHFAAPAVEALFQPQDQVALAGGRTIHELVHHFPSSRSRSLTVIQAMGSVDSNVSAVDAQEVGRVMIQRLGGSLLALNTPAFIPDRRTRDALLKLEQIRVVHEHLERAQAALLGVGTLENSVFADRGVLKPAGVAELRAAGAVGEICGRFFDADGQECATSWRDRVIGIRLEQLRRIPQSIGVVAGSDRTAALLAAVRGGLLKSLVIDEAGAVALLSAARVANESLPPKRKKEKAK